MKLTLMVISAPPGLIDQQDLLLELSGAEPTLGELRNEAKRKLEVEDLFILYNSAILGVGEDAKHLKAHGIDDGGWIVVVVKKAVRVESPGAAASPAATAGTVVPWAPSPAAAPSPAEAPPGAQPKAPVNIFGVQLELWRMQELEDKAYRLLKQVAAEPELLLWMKGGAPSVFDALKTGDAGFVAEELFELQKEATATCGVRF